MHTGQIPSFSTSECWPFDNVELSSQYDFDSDCVNLFVLQTRQPSNLSESSDIMAESHCQTEKLADMTSEKLADSDAERSTISAPTKLVRPERKCVKATQPNGRICLPSDAKDILSAWLDLEGKLYPKKHHIQALSDETGLTPTQVMHVHLMSTSACIYC